jgi:hypothetical protein
MGDLISRKSLLEKAVLGRVTVSMIVDEPAVEPEHGMWIHETHGHFTYRNCCCSKCGGYSKRESNFCPNCGAKMDRGDNGE